MSDPITPAAGLAATLGKLLLASLPSAFGALLSLSFNTRDLTPRARATAFVASWGLAWYLGEGLSDHFALSGPVTDAAKLMIGLFGLNLVATFNEQIPAWLSSARRRLLGDNA